MCRKFSFKQTLINISFLAVVTVLSGAFLTIVADNSRENAFVGYSEKHISEYCKDENEFCSDWAKNGECTKNPGYMEASCAVSCKKCIPGKTEDTLMSNMQKANEIGPLWKMLVLKTHFGDIKIKLRPDLAPNVVSQVIQKVTSPKWGPCRFYRAEGLPEPGAIDNFGGPGPPYALLQGSFGGGWQPIQREGAPIATRGMVCLIGNGPDFFISLNTHSEWGHAHTVWGEVEDMAIVDRIVSQPVKKEVWGKTHVTTLIEPVSFNPNIEDAP